jgi:hypothetical protein
VVTLLALVFFAADPLDACVDALSSSRLNEAEAACTKAVNADRSQMAVRALATVLIKTRSDLDHARKLVNELIASENHTRQDDVLGCELLLATAEKESFVACIENLRARFPTDLEIAYYAHLSAISFLDLDLARARLEEARSFGLPEPLYLEADKALREMEPFYVVHRTLIMLLAGLCVAIAGTVQFARQIRRKKAQS